MVIVMMFREEEISEEEFVGLCEESGCDKETSANCAKRRVACRDVRRKLVKRG